MRWTSPEVDSVRECSHESVAGVVLAGGRSRRMGGSDKAQLLLGGRSMLVRVIDRLRPQVGAVAVSANDTTIQHWKLGVPILADAEFSHEGPLAGILAGMRWVRTRSSAKWVVTTATDTPFIPPTLVYRFLMADPRSTVARVARSRGALHPVCGLWPANLAPDLEAWLAGGSSRKVSDWTASISHIVVEFEEVSGVDPFFNVNTRDDASVAQSLLPEIAC